MNAPTIGSATSFALWLNAAKHGDWITYHRGFFAEDLLGGHIARLSALQKSIHASVRQSAVHLLRRKHGPGDYEYIAVRRRA